MTRKNPERLTQQECINLADMMPSWSSSYFLGDRHYDSDYSGIKVRVSSSKEFYPAYSRRRIREYSIEVNINEETNIGNYKSRDGGRLKGLFERLPKSNSNEFWFNPTRTNE